MRRLLTAAIVAAIALGAAACGSEGYNNPTGPDGGNSTPPPGAITIDIIGINGARSFSPNPATVGAGKMVSWHNTDNTTHRVVLNDGELDTGNISPGKYSAAMSLVTPGGYHCSIHPEMVGTIQ